MSIKEKLSALAQAKEVADTEAAERERNEELRPIRDNISRLDGEERLLRLIAWSLAMKSGASTGKGMAEYKTEATTENEAKGKKLEALVEENREILSGMGISKKEDLLEQEEFSGEQEAVDYKGSLTKMAGIGEADEALKERLTSLGVSLGEEKFSYESAGKAVTERLAVMDDELIALKLKTPEGHKEAVRQLAERIDKNEIPQMQLSGDHRSEFTKIEIAGDPYAYQSYDSSKKSLSVRIYAPSDEYGRETKKPPEFDGWEQLKVPEGLPQIAKKYGDDVAREVFQHAYNEKVGAIIDDREKRIGALREDLKRYEAGHREGATKKYREFLNVVETFRKTMDGQRAELITRGFIKSQREDDFGVFNSLYYTDKRLFYRDEEYRDGGIAGDLEHHGYYEQRPKGSEFSPRFDYEKIATCIQARIDQMQTVLSALKDGNSPEELMRAVGEKGGEIKLPEDATFFAGQDELGFSEKESFWKDNKFEDIYGAKQYLDDEDAYLKRTRKEADQILDLGIDAKLTEEALKASENEHELSEFPPTGGYKYKDSGERFRGEAKRMQDDRYASSNFVRDFEKLSKVFSMDEQIELKSGWIRIPRIQAEYDKISGEIREERRKMQEQFGNVDERDAARLIESHRNKIATLDRNKPKLFVGKWQKERDGVEEEIKALEAFQRTINQLVKEGNEKKVGVELPKVSSYRMGEELKAQVLSGTGREVLERCRAITEKYAQAEIPGAVKDLYEKYEGLRKQLGSAQEPRY
jgi:hypothetical protein